MDLPRSRAAEFVLKVEIINSWSVLIDFIDLAAALFYVS